MHYVLRIVGDGPERNRCIALARRLGVAEHCEWVGTVPHDQVSAQYHWADVFVFSSLRDTSGNVVLEAFSHGVPVICLDHHGARDMVSSECGVKIAVSSPSRVITEIAQAIAQLHDDRQRLFSLSQGALARAKEFLWDSNGDRMRDVYQRHLPSYAQFQPAYNQITYTSWLGAH
jgi:glycosyltransferase involved in cell wall biosynthesis